METKKRPEAALKSSKLRHHSTQLIQNQSLGTRKIPWSGVLTALITPLACTLNLGLSSCHLYHPRQVRQQIQTQGSSDLSVGRLYPINTQQQICNASISQDEVNFPGAMLWLGFSGDLQVNDSPTGFDPKGAKQHDRLTISSPENDVLWFVMLDDIEGVDCEFQDPEWSANPDYLVTLGANSPSDNCDDKMIHSGYAIRTQDKANLKWNLEALNAVATPHLWVKSGFVGDTLSADPQYAENGFVDKASVQQFFGTDSAKMVWSDKSGVLTLKYINYSQSNPRVETLKKPKGKETWKAESALISPDGQFVAYHLFENPTYYESYIQELSESSTPVLISEGSSDPHWWIHPDDPSRVFVVYVRRPAGASYIVKEDLSDPSVAENESAGSTWRQEFRLSAGLPSDIAVERIGDATQLAPLPMKGGRSPSGRFLSTGTNFGYLLELD